MLGTQTPHPPREELEACRHARLPLARAAEIHAHAAACPECARFLARDHLLHASLAVMAAGSRREFDYQQSLRDTLAAAAKSVARAAVQRRVELWSREKSALAGGVVRWVPGGAGARARGQIEIITSFNGTGPWHIQAGPGRAESSAAGGPCASVRPEGPRGLVVQVSHWPGRAAAPLVLLARELGSDAPVVKQARREPGRRAPSARFGLLKPGRYLLGLEPLPAPPDPENRG